ncbi:MAG: alpha/beta fold hydrolase [Gorillibacterium sp.]|nr:alpha/beta fold hydrolase [Gorillibacterium sp.]
MRKRFVAALVLMMLFSAVPALAATEGTKVIVNGSPVIFSDAKPYVSGDTIMLPIRSVANLLGWEVTYNQKTNEVDLSVEGGTVQTKINSGQATVNGVVRPFAPASVFKQSRVYVPLAFFKDVLGYEASYSAAKMEVSINDVAYSSRKIAEQVVDLLSQEKFQQLSDELFTDELKSIVPVATLDSSWDAFIKVTGKYKSMLNVSIQPQDANTTILYVTLDFEKLEAPLTLVVDKEHKLNGLVVQYGPYKEQLPVGVTEEEVVVGQGTPYALQGTLTMPKASSLSGLVPAVVLVQGSGPSDRNETVGGYKPFRDIAYGLAEQGIAVLRYEKRTLAYANTFTPESVAKLTVKEETVDDAIAATKLLKGDPRIDPSQVYVIGHSLGGILAPRIDAEGGDFAGLVLLAGSPRSLLDIALDQNAAFIAAMADSDPAKKNNETLLAAEREKASKLATLTDEQAMATTILGVPAYYFKEMGQHSTADYVAKLTKPVLVLQGEDDIQVYADKDYVLWKKLFEGKANATFKLYPGLNHFFVNYDGIAENTVNEYGYPGSFSKETLKDIADWILKQ